MFGNWEKSEFRDFGDPRIQFLEGITSLINSQQNLWYLVRNAPNPKFPKFVSWCLGCAQTLKSSFWRLSFSSQYSDVGDCETQFRVQNGWLSETLKYVFERCHFPVQNRVLWWFEKPSTRLWVYTPQFFEIHKLKSLSLMAASRRNARNRVRPESKLTLLNARRKVQVSHSLSQTWPLWVVGLDS